MSRVQKSTNLYPHPFSRAYWKDALAELKDTKMLVFAALMIAIRVALKSIYIPVMPNVNINTAFFANALGAMVFGPVVAILAAIISDTLGCILFPQGAYFLPFVLLEIGGSLIFALFLYRAKVTVTRVILSRFCIDFFINIVLNAPIMAAYYHFVLGKSYLMFQFPQIAKNLFMFPIESVLLVLFLAVMIPITRRMRLTYSAENDLKFRPKQIILLCCLFAIGIASVLGYLYYYYSNNSISADYTTDERYTINATVNDHIIERTAEWDGLLTVSVVESAYKDFFGGTTTHNVAVYVVDEAALAENIAEARAKDPDSTYSLATVRGYSKSKAKADDALTRVAEAVIVLDDDTGAVISFEITPLAANP